MSRIVRFPERVKSFFEGLVADDPKTLAQGMVLAFDQGRQKGYAHLPTARPNKRGPPDGLPGTDASFTPILQWEANELVRVLVAA